MQNVVIDLVKNPAIKEAIADKQPGDRLDLLCSIKSKDEQTLVVTVEEAKDGTEPEEEAAESSDTADAEGSDDSEDDASPVDPMAI